MNKRYYTALFTDKKTGNLLYRLNKQAFDPVKWPGYTKKEWLTEKALVLDKLVKERFLNKEDIQISDHEGVL